MQKYKFTYMVEVSVELLTDDKELVRQIENENGTKVTYDSLEDSMRDTIVECLEDLADDADISVKPVKHGEWIANQKRKPNYNYGVPYNDYHCSQCTYKLSNNGLAGRYNFCPNCGVRMDGNKIE